MNFAPQLPISNLVPSPGYNLCGNGNLDAGEQCDCGLVCDKMQSNCCNAATCTFKTNATCSSGLCCDENTCMVCMFLSFEILFTFVSHFFLLFS